MTSSAISFAYFTHFSNINISGTNEDIPKARRTRWGKSWAYCLSRWFSQLFPHVCREILVRNLPCEAVRIKTNVDIFHLMRQIPHCVQPSWELSWVWPIKHPIKMHGILTWLQRCRDFFLRHHLELLKLSERSHQLSRFIFYTFFINISGSNADISKWKMVFLVIPGIMW